MDENENEDENLNQTKIEIQSNEDLQLGQLQSYVNKKPRFSIPSEEYLRNVLENGNKLTIMKCERSKSLDPTQKLDGFDPLRKRQQSIMSLSEWGATINLNDDNESSPW